jgi:hypothetical protein
VEYYIYHQCLGLKNEPAPATTSLPVGSPHTNMLDPKSHSKGMIFTQWLSSEALGTRGPSLSLPPPSLPLAMSWCAKGDFLTHLCCLSRCHQKRPGCRSQGTESYLGGSPANEVRHPSQVRSQGALPGRMGIQQSQ